jgi:hypothetical protein
MLNEYLDTLGLKPGATPKDIKKAYRRLSKVYHPDISKDTHAKEKFIKISEAYQFLLKVGPSPNQETINYDYDPFKAAFEERRREARYRAWKIAKEEERLQNERIKTILNGFSIAFIFILLLNLAWIIDFALPREVSKQKIVSFERSIYKGDFKMIDGKMYLDHDITFEKAKMKVSLPLSVRLENHESGEVTTTRLFNTPISILIVEGGRARTYPQSYSIYRVFGFLIPAMFFISYLYWFGRRTLDFKLTLAITVLLFFSMQLVVSLIW